MTTSNRFQKYKNESPFSGKHIIDKMQCPWVCFHFLKFLKNHDFVYLGFNIDLESYDCKFILQWKYEILN